MKSQTRKNRRYYLHKKAKDFCNINVYKRGIRVTEKFLGELLDWQTEVINELRDKFGYNIQFIIE